MQNKNEHPHNHWYKPFRWELCETVQKQYETKAVKLNSEQYVKDWCKEE